MFIITLLLSLSWKAVCALDSRKNILLILTDDQDVMLYGMYPLQQTQQLVGIPGAQLPYAFSTTPLCCPSRATLLTGQYAHNHRTFNNSASGGCNGNFWQHAAEQLALPVLLQEGGYRTFYAGKYLNEYRGAKVPPGWSDFYGLHGNSRYYNYTMRENDKNVTYTNTYLTDLLRLQATNFLGDALQKPQPFFAMVAPPAAHEPFTPAARHVGVYANVSAFRTPNFNRVVDNVLDKHWLVASAQPLKQSTLDTIDKYYQKRWETLLAVDEMVDALVTQLQAAKQLDNTYIIFTSDNGYHLGQFAQPYDKRQPYETDIRVPMLIRGPDVRPGSLLCEAVSLLDLAPTILDWANLPIPARMDGRSFKRGLQKAIEVEPTGSRGAADVHSGSRFCDVGGLLDLAPTKDWADLPVHGQIVGRSCNLENAKTDEPTRPRRLLIEYWGEGNDGTYNPSCPGKRSDHLAHCTLDADCHCQDAWNNTYACVHTLDRVYCQFRDTENFVEAYDLNDDPYQMTNLGYDLLPIERALYELMLNNLTKCAGAACHV